MRAPPPSPPPPTAQAELPLDAGARRALVRALAAWLHEREERMVASERMRSFRS